MSLGLMLSALFFPHGPSIEQKTEEEELSNGCLIFLLEVVTLPPLLFFGRLVFLNGNRDLFWTINLLSGPSPFIVSFLFLRLIKELPTKKETP
jgi:hypothetical protein